MQRVPYSDQPKIVENANSMSEMATNSEENLSPKTVAKALVMSSEPGLTPKSIFTPLAMMESAVSEQMTMVSAKTSKMPNRP